MFNRESTVRSIVGTTGDGEGGAGKGWLWGVRLYPASESLTEADCGVVGNEGSDWVGERSPIVRFQTALCGLGVCYK